MIDGLVSIIALATVAHYLSAYAEGHVPRGGGGRFGPAAVIIHRSS